MNLGVKVSDPIINEKSQLLVKRDCLRGLMELLARYYGVKVAVILKHNFRGVKVIAGVGLLEAKLQAGLGMDAFLKHGDFVCPDVSIDFRFNSLRAVTGIWGMRFVSVKKLICEIAGDSYFLMLADSEPRTPDDCPKLAEMHNVAQLAWAKIHIPQIIRTSQALIPQVNADADVVARLFENVVHPIVCVTSDLKILSANKAAHPFVFLPPDGVKGKEIKDVFPIRHKIFTDIVRSMFSRETESPLLLDIEYNLRKENGGHVYLKSHIFPILNSLGEIFMIAGIGCDVTVARKLEQKLKDKLKFTTSGFQEASGRNSTVSNPVIQFLTDTLVEQRALRSRNNISYLTVRTWRKPIKSYQIKALKALKRTDPGHCAAVISEEMLNFISSMVGTASFDGIAAIPCGHSDCDSCLSTMIADILSTRTGIPVVGAFEPRPLKGSSHPKASARMPALKLRGSLSGNLLLVDDVVTSGRHLEEAMELIRSKGADVMAIAWIGGEKA